MVKYVDFKFLFFCWLLITSFGAFLKFGLRDLVLNLIRSRKNDAIRAVIYGAGSSGAQLASTLRSSGNYEIFGFIDDDRRLCSRNIIGLKIFNFSDLKRLISFHNLDQVLIAIPNLNRQRKQQILNQVEELGVKVLQIPPLTEITSRNNIYSFK